VDGSQHGEASQAAHDMRRTAWLNRNNFRVIRFWADEVMMNTSNVEEGIEAALREPLPQKIMREAHDLLPPPARGGGI
jgi:very-short-patch-repair endonuclease